MVEEPPNPFHCECENVHSRLIDSYQKSQKYIFPSSLMGHGEVC
jgi:hypothetical protein